MTFGLNAGLQLLRSYFQEVLNLGAQNRTKPTQEVLPLNCLILGSEVNFIIISQIQSEIASNSLT